MKLKIGVLMDAIETIKPYKDTTFLMMLSAQDLGHDVFYFEQSNLSVQDGVAKVDAKKIYLTDIKKDSQEVYFKLETTQSMELSDFDIILMRKDPPFDMEYVYATYILEMAEKLGTLVVNPPAALRSVNEKFFINYFPNCTPKTIVSKDLTKIRSFIETEKRTVVKPMDGMGGMGIFKALADDPNLNIILDTVSSFGTQTIMAQAYLDQVVDGDKRIIVIDGEPLPFGLARIPQGKEFRANLAAGGIGEVQELTEREYWLCEQLKPTIKKLGLLFVGVDVIGGHITEINVTSPTCLREIENYTKQKYGKQFIQLLASKVIAKRE